MQDPKGPTIVQTEQDLARRIELQGLDHIDTLLTMAQLSSLYIGSGEYKDAQDLLDKAFSGFKGRLGEKHYETQRIEALLAIVYFHQEKFVQARQIQERILAIWSEKYEAAGDEIKSIRQNLTNTLRSLGDDRALSKLQEQIVEDLTRSSGADDIETLRAMLQLGETKRSMADFRSAQELDTAALNRAERSNLELRFILEIKSDLVYDLRGLKEYKEGVRLMIQIYDSSKLLPPEDELRKSLEGLKLKIVYGFFRFLLRMSGNMKE